MCKRCIIVAAICEALADDTDAPDYARLLGACGGVLLDPHTDGDDTKAAFMAGTPKQLTGVLLLAAKLTELGESIQRCAQMALVEKLADKFGPEGLVALDPDGGDEEGEAVHPGPESKETFHVQGHDDASIIDAVLRQIDKGGETPPDVS